MPKELLNEKASIDWNNYLTKQEVQKFLSKDDKVESAEEIIYNTKGNFYNKYFKGFKQQGWTKYDLTQDLANFYYKGHLITENKNDTISKINKIVNKCIKAGLKDKLKEYTIPCMRDYQLKFNPTADNRFTPWLYLVKELKDNKDIISWELQEFTDTFIKEANQCIEDNKTKKQENIKICENEQDINIVLEIANSVRDKYVKKRGPGVFLAGCCIEASDELAQILKDKGYKAKSIDGYAIFDDTENSEITYDEHTLVKVDIGNKTYYLDITCEQFEYYIDECETNKIIFQNYCPYWFSEVKPDMDKYTESKSKKQESDFEDYNKRIEEYTLKELDKFTNLIKEKYPNIKVSEPIRSKKGEYRLKLTHKNLIITIMLMEVLATESGKPEYAISYNGRQEYIGPKEDVIDFIDKYISEDYRLKESKHKVEEVSRNELLTKAKMQTKTRYAKSAGYKGFTIEDVDTDHLLTLDTLPITCRVGKYWCTVELQDVLYWIQYEAEKNKDNQVNSHAIIEAILKAVDAMDIKVNCTCADSQYRFNYYLTQINAKYGKPENRPAKITNPHNYGSLCKHLISMLSNKKWMQQVGAPIMDWMEKRIDNVNKFLRVKYGEELTLPNELARKNAKLGQYAKIFDKIEQEEEKEKENG